MFIFILNWKGVVRSIYFLQFLTVRILDTTLLFTESKVGLSVQGLEILICYISILNFLRNFEDSNLEGSTGFL